ncbi:MAG: sigma 54-interacting transcriptional regulator [Bacillota bacterium]|nr:sigma 54-interacting transcriptional regulator [Bacillota bacterium]
MNLLYNNNCEDLLRAINSLYLTVITDEKGNIVYISDDYINILGIKETVIGKHIEDVIPSTKIPDVLDSKIETIGDIFTLKNGKDVICNRILIRDDKNKVIGLISTATFQDLSKVEVLNKKIETLKEENLKYKKELEKLKESNNGLDKIIGNSKDIINLKKKIEKIAKSPISILITGETGTGKEVFANAIHNLSDRSNKRFVKINCAAIPKELIESELFGYAPGSFSGALKNGKIGKFEYANKGTILLDEIGEMPIGLQSKLLRVLEEREVERIGDNKTIPIDVRILCSTNRNLKDMVKEGKFREDLYYRINVIELTLPPLRKRPDDLKELIDFFIEKYNNYYGLGIAGIDNRVVEELEKYDWPGNVRELENAIKGACVIRASGILEFEDFESFEKDSVTEVDSITSFSPDFYSLDDIKEEVEKKYITKVLLKTNGNKSHAAKILDIDRTYLYTKLKKYNIKI